MYYIGQFVGAPDVEIGDSGIVYIFFSTETRESKAVMQCF